jgi:hypothetical protein
VEAVSKAQLTFNDPARKQRDFPAFVFKLRCSTSVSRIESGAYTLVREHFNPGDNAVSGRKMRF